MIGTRDARAQLADQIDAVAVGQPEVGDDEVVPSRLGIRPRLAERVGLEDRHALVRQRGAHELANGAIVLDDQDQRPRLGHGAPVVVARHGMPTASARVGSATT